MRALFFFLLLFCLPTFAYTNGEILNILNGKIDAATNSLNFTLGVAAALGSVLIGWLFKGISDNRKRNLELDLKISKLNKETFDLIHAEKRSVLAIIDREKDRVNMFCTELNESVEHHKLYVANNYTKEDKLQHLIQQELRPLEIQLESANKSLELIMNKVVKD